MNNLPSFLDKKMTVEDIADYHKLPYQEVLTYCLKWESKNLIVRY